MKLNPHLVEKIWGGSRIAKMKGIIDSRKLGESWEVSTLPDQSSVTELGPLSNVVNLSFLVKFIDTTDHLSVQVHPDDDYAKKNEGSLGKSECWYILDAKPGAGIYLGLKAGVTKDELENFVRNSKPVNDLMNFYPVSKGNFVYVPAGTIHAIGKDVFLLEAQQASGITYRFWDWNRLDEQGNSRELHIDKALEVINSNSKYLLKEKLDEFSFKNLTIKLVTNHNETLGKGSLTIVEGSFNNYIKGESLYIKDSLDVSSDESFKGIWVGEKNTN